MKRNKTTLALGALVLVLSVLACGKSATPTTVPSNGNTSSGETPMADTNTPIVHLTMPGEPPEGQLSGMSDHDSSTTANQHRTSGGDDYSRNWYERPFNAQTMDQYFKDLDITYAKLSRDTNWYYLEIKLVGKDANGQFSGYYGLEIDLERHGRGQFLVMGSQPGTSWSTDGVMVWQDTNKDVGGLHPLQSDAPNNGNGYETTLFDSGVGSDPDLAWVRLSPTDPNSVQVAFKRSLINNQSEFLWGAWTMSATSLQPGWFDFNDQFTFAEAGSPMTEMGSAYPIKDLAEVDNTCRWSVGFTPTGIEPGICPVPATPTPTQPPQPGSISGIVFWQINGDLVYHPGDGIYAGATVRVRSGSCGSPGGVVTTTTTGADGRYSVSVSAGTYCVDVNPDPGPYSQKTQPTTVTVNPGQAVHDVNFGYSQYLG